MHAGYEDRRIFCCWNVAEGQEVLRWQVNAARGVQGSLSAVIVSARRMLIWSPAALAALCFGSRSAGKFMLFGRRQAYVSSRVFCRLDHGCSVYLYDKMEGMSSLWPSEPTKKKILLRILGSRCDKLSVSARPFSPTRSLFVLIYYLYIYIFHLDHVNSFSM